MQQDEELKCVICNKMTPLDNEYVFKLHRKKAYVCTVCKSKEYIKGKGSNSIKSNKKKQKKQRKRFYI